VAHGLFVQARTTRVAVGLFVFEGQVARAEHPALKRAKVGVIPAVVTPHVSVLVPPMAECAAVETRPFGEQQRDRYFDKTTDDTDQPSDEN
jgi:hypothetical protein